MRQSQAMVILFGLSFNNLTLRYLYSKTHNQYIQLVSYFFPISTRHYHMRLSERATLATGFSVRKNPTSLFLLFLVIKCVVKVLFKDPRGMRQHILNLSNLRQTPEY